VDIIYLDKKCECGGRIAINWYKGKTDGATCQECFKEYILPVMDYQQAKKQIKGGR